MKKLFLILWFFLLCFKNDTQGQSAEAQQLLLNVEKLSQLKKILDNMYKGYQIVYKGYTTIKNISQGNFNLHKAFLDGLLQVSPVVKRYKKIVDIIGLQGNLVREYRTAFNRFKSSNLFNEKEITYMGAVYDNLFDKSLQNLDELAMVITSGKLRMSDDERISVIDRIFTDMQDKLTFLRVFNKDNNVLAVQRSREMVDTRLSKKLHGL